MLLLFGAFSYLVVDVFVSISLQLCDVTKTTTTTEAACLSAVVVDGVWGKMKSHPRMSHNVCIRSANFILEDEDS